MAFPWLPYEICLRILECLPDSKGSDWGAIALARCCENKSALGEAARLPKLWRSHYEVRYDICRPEEEARRRARIGNDWRALYLVRRQLDHNALLLLQEIIDGGGSSDSSYAAGRLVDQFGYDVWNAFDIELMNLPLSEHLGNKEMERMNGFKPVDLTRRSWILEVKGVISRAHAVDNWGALMSPSASVEDQSFELALASLSEFWSVPSLQITRLLDALFERFKNHLVERGVSYRLGDPELDLPSICGEICAFMDIEGFGQPNHTRFHDLFNHFPHLFLTTVKRTLPMSLIYVFISLAGRLGLDASPVDTPNRVLAYVAFPLQSGTATYVDVYQQVILSPQQIRMMLQGIGPFAHHDDDLTSMTPRNGRAMLLRTARNIFASFHINEHTQGTHHEQQLCRYAATCACMIVSSHARVLDELVYWHIAEVHPLDPAVILRDRVARAVPHPDVSRTLQELYSASAYKRRLWRVGMLHDDGPMLNLRSGNNVRFFVGQIVQHSQFRYIGCILAWVILPNDEAPTYVVLHLDGPTSRLKQDILESVPVTSRLFLDFINRNPFVGFYFKDAELHPEGRRGKFIMNDTVSELYPEDNEFGTSWMLNSGLSAETHA